MMKYQYEFLQWPEYSQDQWIYLFGSVCTQSEKCWDSQGQKGQVPLSVTEILEREDKDYSTHWCFFSTFDKFNLDFPYIFYYTCVIKSLPAVHLTGICVGFSTCCMASFMNCLPSFTALAILIIQII